jgi:hypothetical protein
MLGCQYESVYSNESRLSYRLQLLDAALRERHSRWIVPIVLGDRTGSRSTHTERQTPDAIVVDTDQKSVSGQIEPGLRGTQMTHNNQWNGNNANR